MTIDPRSDIPIYRQVVEQVVLAIASGTLGPGDALPSVRKLATELRINPNTSAKALREMNLLGLACAVRGFGCEVASTAPRVARRIARNVLEREVERVVRVAVELRLDRREIDRALDEEWKEAADAHRGRGAVESLRA